MKWAIAFAGATVCGFVGYRVGSQGDLWLGLSILGTGGVFLLTAATLDKPEPVEPVDTFAPWRQSPHFSPKASASHRPSLRLASSQPGATEAAPGNRGTEQ